MTPYYLPQHSLHFPRPWQPQQTKPLPVCHAQLRTKAGTSNDGPSVREGWVEVKGWWKRPSERSLMRHNIIVTVATKRHNSVTKVFDSA